MIAVVVVRDGLLPAGGAEVMAECEGRGVLIGSQPSVAAEALRGVATDLTLVECDSFQPAAFAEALVPLLADQSIVVLPASPDGRDLAPRLAAALRRPLHAGAIAVNAQRVDLVRNGGRDLHRVVPEAAFIATLQPGARGVVADELLPAPATRNVAFRATAVVDVAVTAVLPPDPATIDLAEAARIVGGGAGLDGADRMMQLADIGRKLGASVGATRVVTDRGWAAHERQIGTTGVVVAPQLYIAFGVAGAVQHTSGLGDPAHIVSVNTDPHCPMMQLADLAIVADANATLDALQELLS
ncbi:MAG: mycofactocin-associated electron transfer flavoprotein alpha subunit [Actinomycetia bacterium]|nr:mycofactocin-associated electron transfer flavoprotein alpha subunit [Actinomycetes bacterium]